MSKEQLTGAAEICQHCNFSEATMIEKIQREQFPAKKNDDGIWIADRQEVDNWIVGPRKDKKKVEAKPDRAKKSTTKVKK